MEKIDRFDKKDVFQEKIEPLIRKLKIECNLEHLPMFVTVAVSNDEHGTEYENDMILSSADVKLMENRIGRLLLLINDFNREPPIHIQRAVKDLEAYLDRIRIDESKVEKTDISLADDRIRAMHGVVAGNDLVVPPKEMIEKIITDEFYND